MDRSLSPLDRHFNLSPVHHIDTQQPLRWLERGWHDLRTTPLASLAYGLFYAALGLLILNFAAPRPHLITAATSGFVLIGPLAAAGLYELSRRTAAGLPSGLGASLRGVATRWESLLTIGLAMALIMLSWERLSAILFALFYPGELIQVEGFVRVLLGTPGGLTFAALYVVIGGMLAALVFALTVVAVPMLMDRETDAVTAAMTSLRAVTTNPRAMLVWAGLIVALIAIGFATLMVGMIVLLPLIGHASWHAYRDLVE